MEELESKTESPVISVQHVSMKYRVSNSDASGLKEFLIQKAKHKVTYREFYALDDVNFDVYKGEVVGIIGTNGSGKSTILKIVSGALKPTSGKVIVDNKKLQLLTLGTGFDMELTARENVYLNGAIIGYTKEFIDSHYDEIVKFAELEDFMNEKVKNFSSGMVSRLGFAIATIGEAADILILDEVLSVGDEFFKKKSLKRVKEMIHSGSTVLMVSHSINTIIQNCTKAVWIEKGKLKMVGEPKEVCNEYQSMFAPEIKKQPESCECKQGGSVSIPIYAVARNDESVLYQWEKKVNPKSNWEKVINKSGTTDTLQLSSFKGLENHLFRCVVSDIDGNRAISDTVSVRIVGITDINNNEMKNTQTKITTDESFSKYLDNKDNKRVINQDQDDYVSKTNEEINKRLDQYINNLSRKESNDSFDGKKVVVKMSRKQKKKNKESKTGIVSN